MGYLPIPISIIIGYLQEEQGEHAADLDLDDNLQGIMEENDQNQL